jgi:hypothetical protein
MVPSWSPGFELLPDPAPHRSEAILDTITFSAFEGSRSTSLSATAAVNTFATCGAPTEIGIEPTLHHGATSTPSPS